MVAVGTSSGLRLQRGTRSDQGYTRFLEPSSRSLDMLHAAPTRIETFPVVPSMDSECNRNSVTGRIGSYFGVLCRGLGLRVKSETTQNKIQE